MRFVFIRHGQPEWFRDGSAVDNPGLTDLGWAQARLAGGRFKPGDADILLVSPLVRARETAEPIAEALGLEPVVLDWLQEIGSPKWEGAPLAHVQRMFEEHREKSIEEIWNGLEGGESFHDFHDRVTTGLHAFLEDHGKSQDVESPHLWSQALDEPRVVIVAHGGTDASAIGYLLGLPPVPWEWERFVTFHSSISEVNPIEINGRHAYSLLRLSDVSHLPPGLQTR